MRRLVCTLVLALLLAGPATRADALSYRHGLPTLLRQEVPYSGMMPLQPAKEKPDLAALPRLAGSPVYLTVKLGEGGKSYAAVFDPDANGKKGLLYFDTDADGDLAEEEALKPSRWDSADNFGPVGVKLKRDGFVGLYHFCVQLRHYGGRAGDRWYLVSACYNVGRIAVGGRTYRVATVDRRADGLFGGVWTPDSSGDLLFVDWNGDGKFAWAESVYCSKRYFRDGRWYSLSVSADGTEVSLKPGDFKMGMLVTDWPKCGMRLMSLSGQGYFEVQGGRKLSVPADRYTPFGCWIERKDADGRLWRASGSGGPKEPVEVKEGEETALACGAPFTATLEAEPTGPYRPGAPITFNARVIGVEGGSYIFRRDDLTWPAPRMTVRDESGKQIGSYAFQYG